MPYREVHNTRIQCQFSLTFYLLFPKGPTSIKRSTTEKLREVFLKYASQQLHGEHYMTSDDFARGYLGLFPETLYNKVMYFP